MSFLKKLFGGSGAGKPAAAPKVAETAEYKGHLIEAMPQAEGGQWRLRARLSKTVDGEAKVHDLIRADLLANADEAAAQAMAKARHVIDESGDAIYR